MWIGAFWTSAPYTTVLKMLQSLSTSKKWCTRNWYHTQHGGKEIRPCVVETCDIKQSQSELIQSTLWGNCKTLLYFKHYNLSIRAVKVDGTLWLYYLISLKCNHTVQTKNISVLYLPYWFHANQLFWSVFDVKLL